MASRNSPGQSTARPRDQTHTPPHVFWSSSALLLLLSALTQTQFFLNWNFQKFSKNWKIGKSRKFHETYFYKIPLLSSLLDTETTQKSSVIFTTVKTENRRTLIFISFEFSEKPGFSLLNCSKRRLVIEDNWILRKEIYDDDAAEILLRTPVEHASVVEPCVGGFGVETTKSHWVFVVVQCQRRVHVVMENWPSRRHRLIILYYHSA